MSTKNRSIWKNRLTLELLGMCAAALLIAIAAANLARNIAVDWIYNVVYSDEKYEQDITDMLQSLQDYVQEEQVTEDNIKQLVNWVRKQKNVYVTFYRDIDELLGPFMANSGDEPYEVDTEYESMYYTVNLYDGTPIKVQLEVYLDMNYMYWADVAMYVTGGIVFLLLLLLIATDMHHYILRAVVDSYKLIPVNGQVFQWDHLFQSFLTYMTDLFVIAFRIILPIFAVMMILNCILGIMAKVAPQMNMFAIGMQMKILIGFLIMFLTIRLLPSISNFVFKEMKKLIVSFIEGMY